MRAKHLLLQSKALRWLLAFLFLNISFIDVQAQCTASSPLYGISSDLKSIVTVNPTTGAVSAPITTIPTGGNYTAMGINPNTGVLFYIANFTSAPTSSTLAYYNPATNTHTTIGTIVFPAGTNINKGGVAPDGKFYFSGGDQLYVYDPALPLTTGTTAPTATTNPKLIGTLTVPGLTATDMAGGDIAFDGFGNMWAVFKNGGSSAIKVVQFPAVGGTIGTTGSVKINQTIPSALSGIAFDASGDMYLGSSAGLFKADTDAGTLTAIGASTAANHNTVDLASCFMPFPNVITNKTVSPTTSVKPGDILTYTITVTNTGNLRADNVTLVDALPVGVDYVPSSTTMNGTNTGATAYPYNSPGSMVNGPAQIAGALTSAAGTAPTSTITFQVKVKDPYPYGNPPQITNQASITYTGKTTPVLTPAVTNLVCPTITLPKDVVICEGASPTLTVNTNASAANVIKFVKFNSPQTAVATIYGGPSVGSATPTGSVATLNGVVSDFPASGASAATYYVYAIIDPAASNDVNCRPFAQIKVTVNPKPNTPNIANPSPICIGQSATLNASGCPSGTSYLWNTAATTASITVAPTATTDYTVQCKDNTTGCLSNVSNKVTLTVNPKPTPPTISAPSSVCSGSSITITQTGCTGIVKWSNGVEGVSSITVSPAANTTYTATCTSNSTTCTSDASNQAVITVNPKPAAPTITPSAANICSGTSTTLTASGCSGTVTWNTGAVTPTITVAPSSTTSYTATCTDTKTGCVSDVSNTSTITVVTPPPTPSINATKTTICSGESTTLSVSNCSGTITWTPAASGTSITVSPTATTSYSASCSTSGTAVVCASPASTALTVTVNPTPAPPSISIAPSPICEGQKATLTATGCTGTVRWSDGQTGAPVTVSPAAGSYSYTATCLSAAGCESKPSSAVPLLVNKKPAPPTIAPTASEVCLGSSVTLTASGCTGTIVWDNGTTKTKGSPLVASPTVDTKYVATCVSAEGCESDVSNTVTVKVNSLPTAPIISTKTPTLCAGDKTQLDATGCTGTVKWSGGETGASITVNPSTTTTYTATCTNATTGCTSAKSADLVITVNAVPTVKAGGNSPLCEGQNVNLTATPNGGTTPYTYAWTNGGAYNSTTQNPTFTATLGSTATYVVTVTDKNGCKASDKVAIEVYQNPSVKIQPVSPYCEGETVQLTSDVSGGSGSYSYSWTGPNGFTSKDPIAVVNSSTPAATGTYVLTVTDAKTGCKSDFKIAVTVNARPKITASANSPVCEGQNINLTSSATGGSGTYTYNWTGPNGFTSTIQNPTLTATMATAGVYVVIVTDAKTNCTAGYKVPVEVYETPKIKKPELTTYCEGDKIELATDVSGGSGSYEYFWEGPNGFTSKETNPTFEATSDAAGTYAITITDVKTGCKVAVKCEIKVNPKLDIKIDGTTNICEGQKIELKAEAGGGSGSYVYEWSGPDGFTSTDQNPTLAGTTAASGSYTVTVTDKETGCKYQASIDVQVNPAFTVSATSTNAKCNGSKDGTATLTIKGGTAPYTYSWSNGVVTQNLTGLGAGTYTVTVTDASNVCSGTASVTITEPAKLTATTVATNLKCNKDNSGKIDLTVTGGTKPYTYTWSNNDNVEDISGLSAGTYTVNITDANGCKTTATATLTEPEPMFIVGTHTNVKCFGGADGTATHNTTTGGTGAYTYSWTYNGSPYPSSAKDLTGLKAGTYEVTMTDVNGCSVKGNFGITQPEVLTIDLVPTTIQCNGASSSITASAKGGTQPYTYAWSNGSTSPNTSGLPAGTYTLTITDANGCKATKEVIITQPSAIAAGFTKKDVLCNGDASGSIEVGASGGTGGLTYTWSDGGTGAIRNNLTAGNYSVSVKDANNCEIKLDVVITQPAKLTASAVPTAVKCFGTKTGSIDLTVSGGVKTYNYSWTGGAAIEDPVNLVAGTYNVTVTDANGCTTTAQAVVTEPQELVGSTTQINAQCQGSKDGSATLTVTGGTTPYTYLWSNGAATQNLTGLGAGTYTVTITDKNGCTDARQVVITEPKTLTVTPTVTEIKCNGDKSGAIMLAVAGGSTPYTYLWNDGVTTQNRTDLDVGTYSVTITDAQGCKATLSQTLTQPDVLALTTTSKNITCNKADNGSIDLGITGGTTPYAILWNDGISTQNRDNLASGTYSVTITDKNGCKATKQVIITQPDVLTLKAVATDVKCNGATTGKIDLTVTGGTAPYTFLWNNNSTTQQLSNLSAGSYSVTVTDKNGCSEKINVEINEQNKLLADCAKKDLLCNADRSGKIDLTVSGGLAPYKFAWSNGETTEDVTGLKAQSYSVVITDANGCNLTKEATLTEPDVLKADYTKKDLLCNADKSGSIDLTVEGGSGPYKFAWSNGSTLEEQSNLSAGTYDVTITDQNGCEVKKSIVITEPKVLDATLAKTDILCNAANTGAINLTVTGGTEPYTYAWSNGSTTQSISNLVANNYSVTVTDKNGCTIKKNITLTQPTDLSATQVATDTKCKSSADGKIDVTVLGGITPYTYLWNDNITTQNRNNLTAGTYKLTITDKNGCTAQVQSVVNEPDILELALTKDTVSCAGAASGTILSVTKGGSPDYTYLWSNGSTQPSVNGLPAGTYSLTVTDKNGCKVTQSTTLNEPAKLSPSAKIVDVNCKDGQDGKIDFEIAGGAAPYKYLWSNGAATQDISGLSAGNYNLYLTDNNGCILTLDFVVKQPAQGLSATEIHKNLTCKDAQNGSIALTVTGGTAPYEYAWSNGETTKDISALVAGKYSVVITDANGCTFTKTIIITEPDALKADCTKKDLLCNNDKSGSINLTVSGGTEPYKYLWNNGATTQSLSNSIANNYTVTITDAQGCELKKEAVLTEPKLLAATCTKKDVLCNNDNTGSIDLSVTGGTAPYKFEWSNGSEIEDLKNLPSGTYTVVVTDANGCTIKKEVIIAEPKPLVITVTQNTDPKCSGSKDGAITVTVTGGTPDYAYLWSNGGNTPNLTGLRAGIYNLTVTDGANCKAQERVVLTDPDLLELTLTKDTVSCAGATSGTVLAEVKGGTPAYSYLWSNGSTQPSVNGLPAGTYTLTVTDKQGCKATGSTTLNEPAKLSPSAKIVDVNCNKGQDGSIDLDVTGGAGPYKYLWNTGATTQDLFNISGGNYSVTITDNNNCVLKLDFVVKQPSGALAVTETHKNLTCNGSKNGSATLTVSGGTAPYEYAWSNGESTKDLTSLEAGNYSVVVTDAQGCNVKQDITITEPAILKADDVVKDLKCNADKSGSIDLTTTGGTLPYKFVWSKDGAALTDTTQSLSNLVASSYSVTITDAQGCELKKDFTITEPKLLEATCTKKDILCNNANTGKIDLTVAGGTEPYTYLWNDNTTTQNRNNLTAGTYSVTITDKNGCTLKKEATLTEPKALDATTIATDANCKGGGDGKIDLTVTGGVTPYSFEWSNGAATEDISALVAKSYSVIVTDANGCTAKSQATVNEPDLLELILLKDTVTCNGAASGTLLTEVKGGTPAYSYLWSNGSTQSSVAGLPAGSYTLTITDQKGCKAIKAVTLNEPPKLIPSAKIVDVNCSGGKDGSIDLDVAGGALPYTYLWSNGATTQDLTGIAAGNYSVIITDNNNCVLKLDFEVKQPAGSLAVTETHKNLTCNGSKNGSATLTVSGGTAPYEYLWSNGETTKDLTGLKAQFYSVVITDAQGCNVKQDITITEPAILKADDVVKDLKCNADKSGSIDLTTTGGTLPYKFVWSKDGAVLTDTTQSLSNLVASSYSVTITDAQGCELKKDFVISQPGSLEASYTKKDVLCNNANTGEIDLTVKGGAEPYQYLWSNGNTTQDISALTAGTYTVTITDKNDCKLTKEIIISQPTALTTAITSTTDPKCFNGKDGAISVTASGGITPYTYLWSNGSVTANLTGLGTGVYGLTVTDANGCTSKEQVVLNQPDLLELLLTKDTVSCAGVASGTILSVVKGGTPTYTYLWSNGSTQPSVSGLVAGAYTLTITDKNGCKASGDVTLKEPAKLAPSAKVVDVNCSGGKDGSIDLDVAGGALPYTYLWSNGATTQDLTSVSAGNYSVTITDNNNCVLKLDFEVKQPAAVLDVVASKTDITCVDLKSGKISLVVTGGTAPYKYLWNDPNTSTTQQLNNLSAGTYNVTVTDANGCTKKIDVTLVAPNCIKPTGVISGTVFVDKDGGNTQTPVDMPGVGVKVYLLDSLGNKIDSTLTDSQGKYSFTVPVGTYSVQMIPPAGQTFVTPKSGTDPTKDSDVNVSGKSTPITLTVTNPNQVIDAGLKPNICSDAVTATTVSATCNGANKNVDGKIVLAGVTSNLKYDVVEGSTYSFTTNYSEAKTIPADGVILKDLASPAIPKVYTVRVFGAAGCYKDMVVTLQPTDCGCPPQPCVPLTIIRKRM